MGGVGCIATLWAKAARECLEFKAVVDDPRSTLRNPFSMCGFAASS
jgi:hypothetical protein